MTATNETERAQQERVRQTLRHDAFAKVGAELFLERIDNEQALVRLHIGNMSFAMGQPRNGLEAASVLRTFRDALTDLLMAAKESGQQEAYAEGRKDEAEQHAWQPIDTAPEDELILVATTGDHVDTAHWTDDGDGVKWWWSAGTPQRLHHNLVPMRWMPLPVAPKADCHHCGNEREAM